MNFGNFSKNNKEYIIDNVATPSPWINYLYNGKYFATISNNGGGISYFKSPLHGRITRYRINDVPHDRPGKYIYVKDRETGEIWSLTWQPVGKNLEAYEVAHGFGYTRAEADINDIKSEVTYFVPQDENMEIWKTILRNNSSKSRKLSIYGYVEFALGHAMVDLINQCDDKHFNRVYFDDKLNSLFATKTYWVTENMGTQQQENKAWDQWAFFTVNQPVAEYETVRDRFIGLYRNENNPVAIEEDKMTSTGTDFDNAVGALRVDIELQPGESTDVIFRMGVIEKENFENTKETVLNKYNSPEEAEKGLEAVKAKWDSHFTHTKVETPDENINRFMNYWIPYQAKVAFDVGRVASFYYWGIARGFGFRDTSQDTIAVTISNSDLARERVLLLSRQIFNDGRSYHHFHKDGQGETTKHCDDPLWFILAVTDYIKESGDFELLNSIQPFADGGEATVLEHMMRITQFVKNNSGKHGLPIFGRGDWNDTLDYIGGDDGGESVWGGMFYTAMLNYLIELLNTLKEEEKANQVIEIRDTLVQAIEENCWDGDWYIRAFGGNDKKIGSNENKFGKIFLNTQSWAVVANLNDKDKLTRAMDSVKSELDTEYGPKICAPAYTEIDKEIGLITRCVKGKKENGAVFCHPTTWLIQAECLLGRGEMAYDYYKKMLPNNVESDIFHAEPYVYSQYITSDEHPTAGRASHSWQTGTAAWMYRIGVDYLLGVRATYHGLLVDPTIPMKWDTVKFERIFRGKKYTIAIENLNHVEHGVKEVYLNGTKLDSNILPVIEEDECVVRVVMG